MVLNSGIKNNVLEALIALAQKHGIESLILFGSRARGDYHTTSDIDLAVRGGNVVRFSLDAEDETPTLLKFDIIDLDGAVLQELREAIETEGIIIYEKI